MFFKFVAVSKDHRRIDGTIESADEKTARETLNTNELAVLTLGEITEEECKKLQAAETQTPASTLSEPTLPSEPITPIEPIPEIISDSDAAETTKNEEFKEAESILLEEQTEAVPSETPIAHTLPPKNNTNEEPIEKIEKTLLEEEKPSAQLEEIGHFWFSAVDEEGNPLAGTIDAPNVEKAYQRLSDEFHLEIRSLRKNNENGEEINLSSFIGSSEAQRELGANSEFSEAFLQQKEGLKQISEAIATRGEKTLTQYRNELITSRSLVEDIQKNIDILNRIRDSYNLETIKKTIRLLGEGVKKALERAKNGDSHKQAVQDLGEMEHFSKIFDIAGEGDHFDKMSTQIISILEGNSEKTTLPKWIRPLFLEPCRAPSPKLPNEINLHIEKIRSLYEEELNELWRSWFSPSMAWRSEAKKNWKELQAKRKELLKELQQIEKQIVLPPAPPSLFLSEFRNFTGWLLAFYLIYFSFSSLVITKNIPLSPDFVWRTLSSPLLFSVLFALFIWNGALTIKIHFLQEEVKKSTILFLGTAMLTVLFTFNF